MLFKRIPSLVLLVATHLLVPLCIAIFLFTGQFSNRIDWCVKIPALALYVILITVAGYWGYLSYCIRDLIVIAFIVGLAAAFIDFKRLFLFTKLNLSTTVIDSVLIILSLVLLKFIIDAFKSYSFDEKPIELSFPFRNGTFSINDGGNGEKSSLMNYHYKALSHKSAGVNSSMQYAIDIIKLNNFKSSSIGILPKELDKYEIFKEDLHSPCNGIIVDVVNQYGNNIPFSGNYPYNVGNCIVIKSGDIFVVMGHLQKDSIIVHVGDEVVSGQLIGTIGNSGWTNHPHLHMQAMQSTTDSYWQGKGIPILFNRSFPVKNKIFKY